MDSLSATLQSISPYSVRADSKLAQRFLNGEFPDMDEHQVARELATIQYLYEHTAYGKVLEDRLRVIAADVKRRHPRVPWSTIWQIVRAYGPSIVKCEAVCATGGTIPANYEPQIAQATLDETCCAGSVSTSSNPSLHAIRQK